MVLVLQKSLMPSCCC